jgi:hypothetical protein
MNNSPQPLTDGDEVDEKMWCSCDIRCDGGKLVSRATWYRHHEVDLELHPDDDPSGGVGGRSGRDGIRGGGGRRSGGGSGGGGDGGGGGGGHDALVVTAAPRRPPMSRRCDNTSNIATDDSNSSHSHSSSDNNSSSGSSSSSSRSSSSSSSSSSNSSRSFSSSSPNRRTEHRSSSRNVNDPLCPDSDLDSDDIRDHDLMLELDREDESSDSNDDDNAGNATTRTEMMQFIEPGPMNRPRRQFATDVPVTDSDDDIHMFPDDGSDDDPNRDPDYPSPPASDDDESMSGTIQLH